MSQLLNLQELNDWYNENEIDLSWLNKPSRTSSAGGIFMDVGRRTKEESQNILFFKNHLVGYHRQICTIYL